MESVCFVLFLAFGKVRLWEINPDASTNMLMMIRHDGPVLAIDWRDDGQAVLSAGADKIAKMWDLPKQTSFTGTLHHIYTC